jgi:hypothetical protein
MTKTNYGRLMGWIITGWFFFALIASALHLYLTDAQQPQLGLLLAVLVPITVFAVWYLRSRTFREFVLSVDPATLTVAQSWRVAGYAFVTLYAYRVLPGVFALPAGLGDMAIGATATLAATRLAIPRRRTGFLVWQALGILDLVTALSMGTLARFLSPQDLAGAHPVSMQPIMTLPLSLIPTFGVPLFLILHMICILQARRWPRESYAAAKREGLSAA